MSRIIRFLAASGHFIITAFTTAVIEEEVRRIYHPPDDTENNRSLVEAVLAWMRSFKRRE